MGITRAAAPIFQLGTTVWRVRKSGREWGVSGPKRVTTVLQRAVGITYYLTTADYDEYETERSGENLFTSPRAADAEADARHNAELEASIERHTAKLRAEMRAAPGG